MGLINACVRPLLSSKIRVTQIRMDASDDNSNMNHSALSPRDHIAEHLRSLIAWLNRTRAAADRPWLSDSRKRTKQREALAQRRRLLVELVIEWLNGKARSRRSVGGFRLSRANFNGALKGCLVYPQIRRSPREAIQRATWVPFLDHLETWDRHARHMHTRRLQAVVYAFDRGWLQRLRRCHYEGCGLWFDAKDPRRQFHSVRCRKNWYDTSPRGRKMRKERDRRYQRELRGREKRVIDVHL